MNFYIFAALLTVVLLAIVLWPALRRPKSRIVADEHEFDATIYKDQLRELDSDIERGAIDPAQAEYARAEIGRRLLAAEEAAQAGEASARTGGVSGMALTSAAVLFVPLAAGLFYAMVGSPGMEAQPLAARIEEENRKMAAANIKDLGVEDLVKRAEAHLAENPNDGRGWDVLAPMYLRMGRAGDARTAFEKALALEGESASRHSGLGQAYYMLANGAVDMHARAEFARALEIDANDSRARFFLALASAENGDVPGALQQWQALDADANASPEWQAAAREGVRRYGGEMLATAPESAAPQLDQQTVRDVQAMAPDDQTAMINGMIAKLDARLRDNPDDIPGWQRLIRSYVVVGKPDEARAALNRAVTAFAADDKKRGQITEFAATLGLSSEGGKTQ